MTEHENYRSPGGWSDIARRHIKRTICLKWINRDGKKIRCLLPAGHEPLPCVGHAGMPEEPA